jgi:hypothetical protein
MYLYALGVYEYDSVTGDITLKEVAQKDTIDSDAPNQLADLESKLLPKSAFSLEPNTLYHHDDIIEFHYIQRLTKNNLILAIVSRSEMEHLVEVITLFKNMTHIYLKKSKSDFTLQTLLHNPLLKEELIVLEIFDNCEEIKAICFNNITKLVHRGEALDTLLEKTHRLKDDVIKLERKAKEANRCCKAW